MAGDNEVKVIFGAEIAGLLTGVSEVKESLETIESTVNSVKETFTGLGEAMAGIFAVEQIEDFIEKISDMGGKIESAGAQLGESEEKILALKYAAGLADLSLDQATKTIDRFYMSAQEAQSATSRQAAAFSALGINAKEYLNSGHNLNQLLDLTVSKMGSFADGATKSTIAMDLFGNRSAETIRFVNILSNGMNELTEASQALGAPTKENIDQLTEIHARMTDLHQAADDFGMSLSGLGLLAVKFGQGFFEALSIISYVFDKIGVLLAFAAREIGGFAVYASTALAGIFSDSMQQKSHEALTKMQQDLKDTQQAFKNLHEEEYKFVDEMENPKLADSGSKTSGPQAPGVKLDESGDDMAALEADLNKKLLRLGLFYEDATRYEINYWLEKKEIATEGTKEYDEIVSKLYSLQKQEAAQNLSDYKSNIEQQQAAAGDDIQKKIALQDQYLNYLKFYYAGDTAAYNDALKKRDQLDQQAVDKSTQEWNKFFNGFNSGINSMIRGTGTWKTAVGDAIMNIFDTWLKLIEQMVAGWIAKETVQTTATQVGNAARVASDTAAAKASGQGFGASAIKQIQGDAAKAYGGVYGFLAPAIGPLAAVPAAAAYVSVVAMEGLIPSFAVGTPNIPVDTFAFLHAGERVMTAEENRAYSSGSGGQMNVTIQAIDQRGIKDFFMQNSGIVAQAVKKESGKFNSNLMGK